MDKWNLFLYLLGVVIMVISQIMVIFTMICLDQVRNDTMIKLSQKEKLLQQVMQVVLFVDFCMIIFYYIPPTPTESFTCVLQSTATQFFETSVFSSSLLMAVHVYLIVTGADVDYLFKTFWRNVILTLIYPFIAAILIPILKLTTNIGFVCYVQSVSYQVFALDVPLYLIIILNFFFYYKTANYIETHLSHDSLVYERMKRLFSDFKYIPMVLNVLWGIVLLLYTFMYFDHDEKYTKASQVLARSLPTWMGTADSLIVLVLQKKIKNKAIENINHIKSYFIGSFAFSSSSSTTITTTRGVKVELKENLLDNNVNSFEAHNIL